MQEEGFPQVADVKNGNFMIAADSNWSSAIVDSHPGYIPLRVLSVQDGSWVRAPKAHPNETLQLTGKTIKGLIDCVRKLSSGLLPFLRGEEEAF